MHKKVKINLFNTRPAAKIFFYTDLVLEGKEGKYHLVSKINNNWQFLLTSGNNFIIIFARV